MGILDELLREKQKLPPSGEYVAPSQIGTVELADVGMSTADIADGAVGVTKIPTSAVNATGGLTGGGGAALTLVPDGTFLELDGGVTPAKKVRIKAAGVTIAKLAASAVGNGLAGGAGVAVAVNPLAAGGITTGAGNIIATAVPHSKLAANAKLRRVCTPLGNVTVGTTDIHGILTVPAGKTYVIDAIEFGCMVAPDAGTSCLASVIRSVAGVDSNVVAADDLETLVPEVARAATLVGANTTLTALNTLRVEVTTVGAVGVQQIGLFCEVTFHEVL